ncbi:hypothetical protein Anas_13466 [Armadillidium nasatum]|uniref:Uncharacterized protein n=1 Tax=Armadillidium nasatum TaxID=96803 RepID=A0A5N5SQY8_9CRUS|nr:hypothetical protein Anas_13466 [Armadillidium nasatum]
MEYVPRGYNIPLLLKENVFTLFKYMISNDIEINVLESYTSKSSFYKYGKVKMDFEGLKCYVLSSVIPLEPKAKRFNIDLILYEMFEKNLETRLLFEIDNLEEKLTFQLNTSDEYCELFIEEILNGELELKGKYCSEIFVYLHDDSIEDPDLVMFSDKKCNKLFILPYSFNRSGIILGVYLNTRKFLKQLVCSECHYKIKDVFMQIKAVTDDDGDHADDDAILHVERDYDHDFHPLGYNYNRTINGLLEFGIV